ncbi:MAG TPA: ATP-binding protein [Patescibacteria group bacterium]|nr:ATP-binding protein [Patescibacteria group bacterium]
MFLNIAVGVLVIAISIIALLVIFRQAKSELNTTFALFVIVSAIWICVNYIGANYKSHEFAKYFIHADLFSGAYLVFSIWIFSRALVKLTVTSKYKNIQNKLFYPYLILVIITSFSTFSNNVISINYVNGLTTITYENLFYIYALALLIIIINCIVNFFVSLKNAKGRLKQQILVMTAGLIAEIIIVAIPNLLVPLFTTNKNTNLITGNLAYVGILVFIFATYYSIVKHKLFDIKLIIARSIGYVFSLSFIAIIFTILTIILSSFVVKEDNFNSVGVKLYYAVLAVLLAILYPYVKKRFDLVSRRVFYRDGYSPQLFIDQLNKALINNIEIQSLLKEVSLVIEQNIKCTFANFLINDRNQNDVLLIGSSKVELHENKELYNLLIQNNQSVIYYDDLGNSQAHLKNIMSDHGIAIIAKLESTEKTHQSNFLIIGDKKSGNIYNSTDLSMIEIITNELVIAIQNSLRFEEIQKFNLTLQERVDHATYSLRKANNRLRVLDETKDDFISMASHQLRTPLTSIKGYISMLLEGDAGKISKIQHDMLGQSFLSSQKMVFLIADMLNVSRLKTGKFAIEGTPVNLADIVEEEMNQLKETADVHEVKLNYDKPKNFPILNLDETKIRQVIMNFSDNAIYYTPKGGEISVKLEEKGNNIELRVKDNGIGVPAHERHHLFTKFYRAGNARKIRPDGTGLGLFMCKKVIIAHGGSLIFDSTEGKGSTFGFIFNKEKLAIKSPAKKPSNKVKKAEPVTV